MVKKNRKRTGYSLIVASGLLLLVGVLLYGLHYVNDVRTELWDSSLSTIIENTDRASDMVAGKISQIYRLIPTEFCHCIGGNVRRFAQVCLAHLFVHQQLPHLVI